MDSQHDDRKRQGADAVNSVGNQTTVGLSTAPPDFEVSAAPIQRQEEYDSQETLSRGKGKQQGQKGPALPPSKLTSPRFTGMPDLEEVLNGKKTLHSGSKGRGVQAVQQCLYDIGVPMVKDGADGKYGPETIKGVREFQGKLKPALSKTGIVDKNTMDALDKRFASFAMPNKKKLSDPWTPGVVKDILKPWSPHTIETLKKKVTLKSFDDIFWTDEEWDGTSWKPSIFPGGGYNNGNEIGVLNSSNENMANTLYHEVLHQNQPKNHKTTLQSESYAYRIGEEMSISLGIGGHNSLRSKDKGGREFADEKKVEKFVEKEYPSVGSGGKGEEIDSKGAKLGEVVVKRADGSKYTRAAKKGEKVPGPITIKNEKTIDPKVWN